MDILKKEYMTAEETEYFQMVENFSENCRKAVYDKMAADELAAAEHIDEILNTYSWNMFEQNKLNELIYSIKEPQEWKSFFKNRAIKLGSLYEQNEAILREIKEFLEEPMSVVRAEFWCAMVMNHFNNRGICDLHCVLPILDKIIPFLEEHNEPNFLFPAYIFYSNFCLTAMYDLNDNVPYDHARKLVALREQYEKTNNPQAIFEAYKNLYFYGLRNKQITPEEAFRLFREMQQFQKTLPYEMVNNRRFSTMLETCGDYWLASVDEFTDEVSDELKKFYCVTAQKRYDEIAAQKIPFRQRLFPFYAYALHAGVLCGNITWDEALSRFYQHYLDHFILAPHAADDDTQSGTDIDKVNILCGISEDPELMNDLLETLMILERWTHKCSDNALCRRVTESLLTDIPRFYHFYTNVSLESSQLLTALCFALLPHIDGAEKKERWILELVTKKQFATHLHSVMVQKIAVTVASSLYEARPELFDTVKAQIGGRPLMGFIGKCALFHDVGKNDIATIVNTQARALDDIEFAAIKKHPYFGYHRFLDDPDFSCYKDVVMYHHKTYDGKGGYPVGSDKADSPYGIIVDLITICDCFDAATDSLGRNYKRAKTVEELIGELTRDAGTRYNPDIAAHIRNTPMLQSELKRIIVDERLDTAYEIASSYIK